MFGAQVKHQKSFRWVFALNEESKVNLSDEQSASGLSLVASWGVLGTLLLLGDAVARLLPKAVEPIAEGQMSIGVWGLYAFSVVFMAYAEGYKGFQLRFSPRVVARAARINQAPWWCKPLAPLFCMGLVHATRRRLVSSWVLLLGIIMLVMAISGLAQPWRGAIDAGVVVGLSWGMISVLVSAGQHLRGRSTLGRRT